MRPLLSISKVREEVVAPPRRRMSRFNFGRTFWRQNGKCACGCGEELIEGQIDEEHGIPLYFQDADQSDGTPDALWLRGHHKPKTKTDLANIAKVKRIRGETGKRKPGARVKKLQSRNTLTKEHRREAREWKEKRDGDRGTSCIADRDH